MIGLTVFIFINLILTFFFMQLERGSIFFQKIFTPNLLFFCSKYLKNNRFYSMYKFKPISNFWLKRTCFLILKEKFSYKLSGKSSSFKKFKIRIIELAFLYILRPFFSNKKFSNSYRFQLTEWLRLSFK